MKISIVIPVYNEGEQLVACLDNIEHLENRPYEVIVVDNNSTDATAAIAQSRSWVTYTKEAKQGVVYARTTGFNAAKGEIIARIDADSLVSSDWLDIIKQVFTRDKQAMAVSGSAEYPDFFFFSELARTIDLWTRGFLEARLKDRLFLHGANMAVRKSAWRKVKKDLCVVKGIHEDLDLAIHLQEGGMKVVYEPQLVVGVSSRRIASDFRAFIDYSLVSPRTYAAHGLKCQRYMYGPIIIICALYGPGHLAYNSYDPIKGSISIKYLINSRFRKPRIDPTINVAS